MNTNFAARKRSGTGLSKFRHFFLQNDVTRRRTPRPGIRVELHIPFPFHSFSIFFDEEKNHRYSATFPNNSLKFNSIHENKSSETLADDSWKRDDSRFLFRLFLPISYKNKMIRTIKDRSTWSKENSRSSDRRTKEKQRKSASSWEERAF